MPLVPRSTQGALMDIYAVEELSISDRENIRQNARNIVLERAVGVGAIAVSPDQLQVRSIRPFTDITFGAQAFETWLTPALVSAAAANLVNDITLDVKRELGIYGYWEDAAQPGISEVRFRQNTGGAVPLAFVNVQHLRTNLVLKGLLSDVVVYDPQDVINITAMADKTLAGGTNAGFLGYVAEPRGRSFIGPVV